MSLNCKIIYIIQSNVIFVKNFCFKDAVKVKRFYVENDDDFVSQIFERNFFANINSSFCLVQQITPEDEKKYFIFGVKFDDLYIFVCCYINIYYFQNSKKQNSKNIFVYEKTYLFISTEPLCKLFEKIFNFILNYKKLSFYQNLEDYNSLLEQNKLDAFHTKNIEKVFFFIITYRQVLL